MTDRVFREVEMWLRNFSVNMVSYLER